MPAADHHRAAAPRTSPPSAPRGGTGEAWFAGVRARHAVECVDLAEDSATVARGGFWAVVGDFDGPVRAWRFAEVTRTAHDEDAAVDAAVEAGGPQDHGWRGPRPDAWTTSLDRARYVDVVEQVRQAVRAGDVYQANVCRVLEAPLPGGPGDGTDGTPGAAAEPSARALSAVLARGNPAPFAGGVHVPAGTGLPPAWVASASPELYLRLADGVLESAPIKGTAATPDGLTPKDRAENVMITDLVRNDLQRVCSPGTVEVTSLLRVEEHPGLVHLVSRVRGTLSDDVVRSGELWRRLLAGTFPPGSVSGAPKSSALRIIRELEPVPRGPYCGAVGWVADGEASLAVGIRTFWWADDGSGGVLRFGTGAGITWGSDPTAEWHETELKAERLVALASEPR